MHDNGDGNVDDFDPTDYGPEDSTDTSILADTGPLEVGSQPLAGGPPSALAPSAPTSAPTAAHGNIVRVDWSRVTEKTMVTDSSADLIVHKPADDGLLDLLE